MSRPRTRSYLDSARTVSARLLHGVPSEGEHRLALRWSDGSGIGVIVTGDKAILAYAQGTGEERTTVVETVGLERAPRRFGGHQLYLRCPRCGRRAQKLYMTTRFVCRGCTGRAYFSQSLAPADLALRRHYAVQQQIEPGVEASLGYIPPRPKRMRHATYQRLTEACLEAYNRREEALFPGLERLLARLTGEGRSGRYWSQAARSRYWSDDTGGKASPPGTPRPKTGYPPS